MVRRAKKFTIGKRVLKTVTSAPALAILAGAGTAGAGLATGRPTMATIGGQILVVGGSGVVAQQAIKHPKVLHMLHLDKRGRVKHMTTHNVRHAKKLKNVM